MVTGKIEAFLKDAIEAAQEAGTLPSIESVELGVEKSRVEESDYSSTLPMRIARAVGASPREIATAIVDAAPASPMLSKVGVAGPGFINFVLADSWVAEQVGDILGAGSKFGHSEIGEGQRIQVEYPSINPTGPLTVGHGRIAVVGDVLSRVLAAAGYDIHREYYVNDCGNQIRLLGESLYSRYAEALGEEAPFPPTGYKGEYVRDWGVELAAAHGRRYLDLPQEETALEFTQIAIDNALGQIRDALGQLGIEFDEWFSEAQLHASGDVSESIERLRERGYVIERAGATWFTAGDEENDQENVLIKRTGDPTYLASDIAYHNNKFVDRGFGSVINVMGADHHGHVQRMYAAMDAMAIDRERLTFVLCQMVHVIVEGVPVKQSKRSGDFELLSQVVEEIGPDATRYFMIFRSTDSQMDFDVDLAMKKSDENPVHKIRYAHARIASILRKAKERAIDMDGGSLDELRQPEELALIRTMLQFPEVVASAARRLEPHQLPHFALDLAGRFNSYYHVHRVISSDKAVTKARLRLALAVKRTLANALNLMGISAPELMVREDDEASSLN